MTSDDIQSKIITMKAQEIFFSSVKDEDRATHYTELLQAYNVALEEINTLSKQLEKPVHAMPSKKDLESMGAMLDLINKIDTTTLEKLNKFGGRPVRRD